MELTKYLNKTKVEYKVFTIKENGAEFLCDRAVKKGATYCISIRNNVDFYFNDRGTLVGTATESINSFRGRK